MRSRHKFGLSRVLLVCFLLFATSLSCYSQAPEIYHSFVEEAENAFAEGDFNAAARNYAEAFVTFDNKGFIPDRYNAGCAYALAGVPDSAFVQLFKIAHAGNYMDHEKMLADQHLVSLHKDSRWDTLNELITKTREKEEAKLDKTLMVQLEQIHETDQKYRQQLRSVIEEHGRNSQAWNDLWKVIQHHDSINLVQVTEILETHGWLGKDVVGEVGNSTLFLVIQHADLQTQVKYLPMVRKAHEQGNARGSSLALLEDRVALRQGNKQIYGSQIAWDKEKEVYYVQPLEDPENVDQRREAMHMPPLQLYLDHWDLTWDVEAYKKDLAEREAKQ